MGGVGDNTFISVHNNSSRNFSSSAAAVVIGTLVGAMAFSSLAWCCCCFWNTNRVSFRALAWFFKAFRWAARWDNSATLYVVAFRVVLFSSLSSSWLLVVNRCRSASGENRSGSRVVNLCRIAAADPVQRIYQSWVRIRGTNPNIEKYKEGYMSEWVESDRNVNVSEQNNNNNNNNKPRTGIPGGITEFVEVQGDPSPRTPG